MRISDNQLIHTLVGHTGRVTKLRFSPTGDRLVSAAYDGWVRIWDRDGKQVNAFQPGGGEVLGIGISPDGRFLAYADIGKNNIVVLSSPDGAQKMRTLEGHQGPVWAMIFSSDSTKLASADGIEIRIWQVEDGRLLYVGKPTCP